MMGISQYLQKNMYKVKISFDTKDKIK